MSISESSLVRRQMICKERTSNPGREHSEAEPCTVPSDLRADHLKPLTAPVQSWASWQLSAMQQVPGAKGRMWCLYMPKRILKSSYQECYHSCDWIAAQYWLASPRPTCLQKFLPPQGRWVWWRKRKGWVSATVREGVSQVLETWEAAKL